MRGRSICFAASSLVLSTVSFGQWYADGEKVPDTPARKLVHGFGVMLFVTDKPDAFFEEWQKPDPEFKPTISTTLSARRSSKVVGVVIFTGCHPNAQGLCDAEVDFTLLRPDGSIYGEYKGAEVWRGRPTPPNGNVQLSVGNLGFRIELDDPLGKYKLKALVRDKVANIEIPLVQEIEVLPAN